MNGRSLLPAALPAALLLFLAGPPPARPADIPRLSARLDPPEAVRGRTVLLTVSASWEGEASVLTFSRPAPPACRGLSVESSSQRSLAYREGGELKQVREFLFTLRGEEEGTGRVGPVRLTYRRPPRDEEHSLTTEPLEIPVVSRRPSPLPVPAGAVLALAGAALIAVYVRWMVRRYQKKSNEIIADFVENLESRTLKELEGARVHRLEGEAGRYCRAMRAALLRYLEERASAEPEGGGEPELSRILKRLDECWFGGTGDDMERLDVIHRRITVLLKERAGDAGGSKGEDAI